MNMLIVIKNIFFNSQHLIIKKSKQLPVKGSAVERSAEKKHVCPAIKEEAGVSTIKLHEKKQVCPAKREETGVST